MNDPTIEVVSAADLEAAAEQMALRNTLKAKSDLIHLLVDDALRDKRRIKQLREALDRLVALVDVAAADGGSAIRAEHPAVLNARAALS